MQPTLGLVASDGQTRLASDTEWMKNQSHVNRMAGSRRGNWYLLTVSGTILASWQRVDSQYCLNDSGAITTNWSRSSGSCYRPDKARELCQSGESETANAGLIIENSNSTINSIPDNAAIKQVQLSYQNIADQVRDT